MSDSPSPFDLQIRQLNRTLEPSAWRLLQMQFNKVSWRLTARSGRAAKRTLDIVVASSALLVLSPLLLIVAAAIKLTDRGPVLFWQNRVGKWGTTFRFPKFRSMVVNAEALRAQLAQTNVHGADGVTFKMANDPRITRVGRIIRRTSIDELPQLWCVLMGDMSLVGPRPALPAEVNRYSLDDRRRLDTVPGLTCTWQVSGRSDIPFPEQLRLDVEYIERQSLSEDLRLLLRTVPAVVSGRGAY
jgi:lipopolysaccharide/colanic/teichoic acid biosynthesis glycosyltransferase